MVVLYGKGATVFHWDGKSYIPQNGKIVAPEGLLPQLLKAGFSRTVPVVPKVATSPYNKMDKSTAIQSDGTGPGGLIDKTPGLLPGHIIGCVCSACEQERSENSRIYEEAIAAGMSEVEARELVGLR